MKMDTEYTKRGLRCTPPIRLSCRYLNTRPFQLPKQRTEKFRRHTVKAGVILCTQPHWATPLYLYRSQANMAT